ncbi:MAG TPA: PD-(D/E)XK nuclease family protein [Acidobacteriota bacterium]|nr:PD-(D/E)XK nuclease family protein [Acidobacteriota bacterium]
MAYYSHTQLETFLQCKLKYKFKYIDRIIVDVPRTIELYMGDLVHQTLRMLYESVNKGIIPPKQYVIDYFVAQWAQQWSKDIVTVKSKTAEEYQKMGEAFLLDFYLLYFPFDQFEIVGLETSDRHILIDGNEYSVRIDKLAKDAQGIYYVCDYKTNNKLKTEDDLKADRQLAMYALWVKQKYADCKDVKLVWYFLAHKKKFEITHDAQSLSKIEQETVDIIRRIAATTDYAPAVTPLCGWCPYKNICPAHNTALPLRQITTVIKDTVPIQVANVKTTQTTLQF